MTHTDASQVEADSEHCVGAGMMKRNMAKPLLTITLLLAVFGGIYFGLSSTSSPSPTGEGWGEGISIRSRAVDTLGIDSIS